MGCRVRDGRDRVPAQLVQHALSGARLAAEAFDLVAVMVKEPQNLSGGVRGLPCGLLDAFQKEPQPAEPIASYANGVAIPSSRPRARLALSIRS